MRGPPRQPPLLLSLSLALLLAACGGPRDAPALFLPTPFPAAPLPTATRSPPAAPTPGAPTPPAVASATAPGATPPAAGASAVSSSACSARRGPPRPGTGNQIDQEMRQAAALLGPDYFQHLPQLTAALVAAGRASLEGIAGLPTLAQDAKARSALADLLALPAGQPPTVTVVDVQPDLPALLIAYGGDPPAGGPVGLPLLLFSCQGGQLASVAVDPRVLGDPDASPNFRMRFVQAVDVTGDGRRDLVLTATHQGGSGFTVVVGLLGWDGRQWATRFAAAVPHWQVGQAGWRLLPHGGGQDLQIDCPAMGPFDHKLLAHPTLTRTYRWDGHAMTLAAVALAPATTQRDAFNRGEVAFRAGDHPTALSRYRTVVEDPRLQQDAGSQTDWPGLALLRIGESAALLGRLPEAKESLARAGKRGGSVGALALAFRAALGPPDGVARAFAALPASAVAQRLFVQPKPPRDLGPEMDATGLLQPGLAVSAYLDAHPDAAPLPAAALRSRLEAIGLPVRDLARVDLDGDGQAEVIALLPAGGAVGGWVVTRQRSGHWRAWPVGGPQRFSGIGAPRPRPDGPGAVVPLAIAGALPPGELLVGLNGGRVQDDGPDGTPVPGGNSTLTMGCDLAAGLAGG